MRDETGLRQGAVRPALAWEPPASDSDSDFGDSFLREVAQVAAPFRKPLLGERLGGAEGHRFEILSELGGGAMGQVFRARDEELQRVVALKFLLSRERRGARWPVELLRQEARAVARLDHENIVRIFDVSEWVGAAWEPRVPFLIMECLEGESLATLLHREGRLGVRRSLELMAGVAAGLAHAHGRHIVHRDLKPSNVFVGRQGQVKLLDFGLAWWTSAPSVSIPSLPTAGTPPYMSPEQWGGGQQDERSDLWSAGVVLYELLTGELPFPSATLDELRARVMSSEPAPLVRLLRPEVPEEVEALVASALAKAPRQRLPSAAEFRDRLRRLEERLGPWREDLRPLAPQRRSVTLVACRLSLAGRQLDAEDVSEQEADFQKDCSEIIQEHGGSITTCVGDEVLACFGYPVAHEEDSEQAVRAGLRLASGRLHLDVGLHTDLVVFDDNLPGLRGRTPTIQGEAPRIASWLARGAKGGTVVLSQATHSLVRRAFETGPLGTHLFEGLTGARRLDVWQVQRARKTVFRFDRSLATGVLSPLVGREEELGALLGHWEQAWAGHGSVVLLSAEAGLGKSRLIQEARQRITASSEAALLRCQCWEQFSQSAFHPIITLFQHHFRLDPRGTPGDNLARLEQQLGAFGLEPEHMGLIAAFLSLPVRENLPFLQLSPDRQKERTREALVALLLRIAEMRPVFGVVEDIHWADPSTLELLDAVLARVGGSRMLLVLSLRAQGTPRPWPARGPLHRMTLERLPASLTALLVREAAGVRLPEETVRLLVEKTDGIPLFVEEFSRMVGEGGVLASIPLTLNELLLARLDALPERLKALAQVCAVVGRGFSEALMATLTRREPGALQHDLEALVAEGLLRREEEDEDGPGYQFRHALMQDAAYQSLLRGTRREHHRRIAQSLEEHFPKVVQTQPEVLAHHYTEAGVASPAIRYWMRAGVRASLHSANQEAVSHLRRALELLAALPDTPERAGQELQLLIALGTPLFQVEGYRSPEVRRTYVRARELFRQVGDALPALELSYWGPFAYFFARAEFLLSHELAELLVDLGTRQQRQELLALGYRMLSTDLFTWGRMGEALEYQERAVVCSDFPLEEHRRLALRHWVDPRAVALVHGAVIHSAMGDEARAGACAREALELAGRIGHAHTRAYVLLYASVASQLRGDVRGTLALAEECHALASEHGFRLWRVYSGVLRAWAISQLGRAEEGLAHLRAWLGHWRGSGIRAGMPHHLGLLADVHLRRGEPARALQTVHEALRWADTVGERYYEAELHRLGAEAHRALGDEAPAREGLLRAVALAREQGAGAFERRALEALAGLVPEAGRPGPA